MSNVTAVLQCPGCDAILEAEERPNIDWKLGTTRVVLVPEQTAIEHFFECLDFARPDLSVTGPATLEGTSPDIVIIDETGSHGPVLLDDPTVASTEPAHEAATPTVEPTEKVEETAPADTKPAPKRRTSK